LGQLRPVDSETQTTRALESKPPLPLSANEVGHFVDFDVMDDEFFAGVAAHSATAK
jgi:hypothetical protein